MYAQHPFHWVPANGARHASIDPQGAGNAYVPGVEITTLCTRRVAAETGDMAWLWETCPECNAAARVLAGLPPMVGAR
ncbi:hypothetical protein HUO13_35365 [Saccharopolyspora erythraea]|uniref:zinc finger protein n=1 Tax=Saccharopolyspora erythraea TaxID=1836 RepID=UPI001BA92607|nr:zinc finger protein [Saccharopolyspora erythraea]QUH05359.1 hypothetical protein HUO13_35365 [Saccharopolyspora erythraea]